MHCKICGKYIFENSHYIDGEYYHNDCIKQLASKENELYCAEYSLVQKAFHIDTLDRIVEMNGRSILKGVNTGYQIFEVGTYEECVRACNEMKATIRRDE